MVAQERVTIACVFESASPSWDELCAGVQERKLVRREGPIEMSRLRTDKYPMSTLNDQRDDQPVRNRMFPLDRDSRSWLQVDCKIEGEWLETVLERNLGLGLRKDVSHEKCRWRARVVRMSATSGYAPFILFLEQWT